MRLIKIIATCGLIISLSGCAVIRQHEMDEAMSKFSQDKLACGQQYGITKKSDINRKNILGLNECVSSAYVARMQEARYPYMGNVLNQVAANHKAAIAYSKGKIDRDEFDAATEQNQGDFLQVERSENVANDERQSHVWSDLMHQGAQNLQGPQMKTTNCNAVGTMVNCTSY